LFADLTVFLKRSAARSAFQKPLCYGPFAHLADLTDLFRRLVIENRGVVGRGVRPAGFFWKVTFVEKGLQGLQGVQDPRGISTSCVETSKTEVSKVCSCPFPGRTHNSVCKRDSLNVPAASPAMSAMLPKADNSPHRSEMTRWANTGSRHNTSKRRHS